jgi:hypothetical protein
VRLSKKIDPTQQPLQAASVRSPSPVFLLRLQAQPGTDATRNLRALLKLAGRRFQLRCIGMREESPP